MIEFIGGLIIGLLGGSFLAIHWMRFSFLSGRITARSIAEYCDAIIDAQAEQEEPSLRRTPL